jgi:hypothetical protein
MKVRELLLEYREVLDRHGHYGAWINAETKEIQYVKKYRHMDFIEKTYPESLSYAGPMGAGGYAFEHHLVRVEHSRGSELNIEGVGSDIQKISRILIATIVQPDLDEINVHKHINLQTGQADSKRFVVMGKNERRERQEAIKFVQAG